MPKSTAAFLVVLLLAPAPGLARPGNPERYPIGARATGMGGAAVALGLDPWHNPAAAGRAQQSGLSGSLSAYGLSREEVPAFVDMKLDGRIAGGLHSTSVDLFPLSMSYVRPLGSRAWGLEDGLGLSLVVPDYDHMDATLEVPAQALLYELQTRLQRTSRTFWLVLAWGACHGQRLCFGLGPAAALTIDDHLLITTVFQELADGSRIASSVIQRFELLAVALGAQAGLQLALAHGVRLGLTARTPVRTLYGRGSMLIVSSQANSAVGAASWVDRVEVDEPQLDYRLPWRFALGLGREVPGSHAFGLDLRLFLAQPEYTALAGPNKEEVMMPVALGRAATDPARALPVGYSIATTAMLNANLGGELQLTEQLTLQGGLFTDLSSTPEERVLTGERNRHSRLGLTLGAGWPGGYSATWVSLVAAYGWGASYALRNEGGTLRFVTTGLQSWSVMLVLGSTATL
ncbi:MAG: hypothetical protein FJ125_00225 [Deltaproteobacteria bacterium]|nr:hypothetical protein [Deltaproteobacteria bacterium]